MGVDLTRRSFLGGLLAVTAVAIIKPPKLNDYPILYMDDERSDSPALQAMLDGKPYIVEGNLISGQVKAVIDGGTYRLDDQIHIKHDNCRIQNATFKSYFDKPVMVLHGKSGVIRNCTFIGNLKTESLQNDFNKLGLYSGNGENIRAAIPAISKFSLEPYA